jgi:hypothetical protein
MYRTGEQIRATIEQAIQRNKDLVNCMPVSWSLQQMKEEEAKLSRVVWALQDILSYMEVQEGDKATGAEILAGMPREEQELFLIACTCPDEFELQNFGDGRCDDDICGECKLKSLNAEYTYHNGKWEGEKVENV